MTKISRNVKQALDTATMVVRDRVRSNYASPFTATEFLRGVLPPEDFKVLNAANSIVNRGHTVRDGFMFLQLGDGTGAVRVHVHCAGGLEVLVPNATYSISTEAPHYEGITGWVNWHREINTKFDRVLYLVEWAYNQYYSLEQLRYVLPGIVMLCKNDDYLTKYVDRLQDYKPPSQTPRLDPYVRQAAAAATEMLSMAALATAKDPDTGDFIALQL
jgi:hypothetical protein